MLEILRYVGKFFLLCDMLGDFLFLCDMQGNFYCLRYVLGKGKWVIFILQDIVGGGSLFFWDMFNLPLSDGNKFITKALTVSNHLNMAMLTRFSTVNVTLECNFLISTNFSGVHTLSRII
jgi:hypothetical protein